MLTIERRLHSPEARAWYNAPYASDAAPIIVGGCGRSGTTLIRVILDTHSKICCGPESTLFLGPVLDQSDQADLARDFDLPEARVGELVAASGSHAEFIDRFFAEFCRGQEKAIWAEKTPRNVHRIDYIFEHFPKARFIHMIRDGRDTITSLLTHPRYRVVDGKMEETGIRHPINKPVKRWLTSVRDGIAHRGDPRYYELRYEDLVENPRTTLQSLLQFLGLEWEEELLNFHEVERGSRDLTRSPQNPGARQPISTSRVGRWQKDLTEDEKVYIDRNAGEMLQLLGYGGESAPSERALSQPRAFAELAVGQRLKVKLRQADGRLEAVELRARPAQSHSVIEGAVDWVDAAGGRIRVIGREASFSPLLEVEDDDGGGTPAGSLQPGDGVRLRGRFAAGSMQVDKLHAAPLEAPGSGEIQGDITAIDPAARTIEIAGATVVIPSDAMFKRRW